MKSEMTAAGLRRLKALRDQAFETHKTAGDASAHVSSSPEVQPAEEWRFRQALRENADLLLDLAEQGLDAPELALSLKTLAQGPEARAGRAPTGALTDANAVLRAYEAKHQARLKTLEANSAAELETAI
jgi:hypothetical protein